jgi:hypothetical protein
MSDDANIFAGLLTPEEFGAKQTPKRTGRAVRGWMKRGLPYIDAPTGRLVDPPTARDWLMGRGVQRRNPDRRRRRKRER